MEAVGWPRREHVAQGGGDRRRFRQFLPLPTSPARGGRRLASIFEMGSGRHAAFRVTAPIQGLRIIENYADVSATQSLGRLCP